VADSQRTQIRAELKWLNAHLGGCAIWIRGRTLGAVDKRLPRAAPSIGHGTTAVEQPSAAGAGASLGSLSAAGRRHIRLVENDPGASSGKAADQGTHLPIAAYGADKLNLWRQKLLKRAEAAEWTPRSGIAAL